MTAREDSEGTRMAAAAPPSASRSESARLNVEDLEALADEASRQSRSLACLIGAMEEGAEIAWMGKEGD